jgi:response regulator NasT
MLPYYFVDPSLSVPPVALPTSQRNTAQSFSLTGKRAIIVEDEGITQLQLTKILRSRGIQVVGAAANGKEAVEIVLREHPDFVLMDIRMPVMDGLEASERILAEYRVCIVMLTAFSEEEYQQRAQELGTCGYVLKPITAETLLPELEAAYDKFHQS